MRRRTHALAALGERLACAAASPSPRPRSSPAAVSASASRARSRPRARRGRAPTGSASSRSAAGRSHRRERRGRPAAATRDRGERPAPAQETGSAARRAGRSPRCPREACSSTRRSRRAAIPKRTPASPSRACRWTSPTRTLVPPEESPLALGSGVAQHRLRAGVSGYNVDARIFFGSPSPSHAMLGAAQRQLGKLVVSGRAGDDLRPPGLAAAPPRHRSTLFGTVDNGQRGRARRHPGEGLRRSSSSAASPERRRARVGATRSSTSPDHDDAPRRLERHGERGGDGAAASARSRSA